MTSAISGTQSATVTAPSASSDTSLSGRNGEKTRSTQCSQRMAASSDPSERAAAGTSKETTVPITGSACRRRAARAPPACSLLKKDAAVGDLDLLGGQRPWRGACDDVTRRDAVLAAVTRAVDGAVADLVDDAPHVGAHRAERLELAGRRLGDDDLLDREDLAAARRDLGGGCQRVRAGGAACPRRRATCLAGTGTGAGAGTGTGTGAGT